MLNSNTKVFTIVMLFVPVILLSQTKFNDYFENRILRIDYCHTGNTKEEIITVEKKYKEGEWGGSILNLIDSFNNGKYYYKVYAAENDKLLFSRGFNSYFGEYITTEAAKSGVKKTFFETAILPFPKVKIKFIIETRDSINNLYEIFNTTIDPTNIDIIEEGSPQDFKVVNYLLNGDSHKKVDLLFIAEGYKEDEYGKFENDVQHFSSIFLSKTPFRENKNAFNIRAVFRASAESGCDEPTKRRYKQTAMECSFNAFDSERYLLCKNLWEIHNIASAAPYDYILIMVNSSRYGGGGIYNFYATFTSDNSYSDFVFIHEFGHLFGGLADEYYSSSTGYVDFYNVKIEPLEPNITILNDINNLKWKELVKKDTPIPTLWEKDRYDSVNALIGKISVDYNEKFSIMKRQGGFADSLKEILEIEKVELQKNKKILSDIVEKYDKVGAYEGAGYLSHGMYRSQVDCIMRSRDSKKYCAVCRNRIEEIIHYYSNK